MRLVNKLTGGFSNDEDKGSKEPAEKPEEKSMAKSLKSVSLKQSWGLAPCHQPSPPPFPPPRDSHIKVAVMLVGNVQKKP